jgi:hypothetical protein
LRGAHPVRCQQRCGHLAERALRAIGGRAHRPARHRTHRYDKARRDVRGSRRAGWVDAEGGADRHPTRSDISPQIALGRGSSHSARWMARQPNLAVARDSDRGRAETTHRDARFVQRCHS